MEIKGREGCGTADGKERLAGVMDNEHQGVVCTFIFRAKAEDQSYCNKRSNCHFWQLTLISTESGAD